MAEANETHFTVYNKSDVPDRFHYRDNDRISPIVLIAEPGWSMKKVGQAEPTSKSMFIQPSSLPILTLVGIIQVNSERQPRL